ncbi:MAG: methyltransferase domain-containing protein [Actinobacteria bacterium]|nr:methyltransferase domain-containing protein [Actinomycetota bacterium]
MLAKVPPSHVHLPGNTLDASRMPGHWLLARLGKTVLRPGGSEMTSNLLDAAAISASDEVIEVAPGLGVTTRRILAADPARYVGVDRDPDASAMVGDLLDGPNRTMLTASAQDTGLPTASADVVFGEAYLTMQPDSLKQRILTELTRLLRPGGRFALHEIAFAPDDVDDEVRTQVRADLTSTIKVSVHPLTVADWDGLLAEHGLAVASRFRLPLHLLEPRRLLDDEGVVGATRFVGNVLRDHDARSRVRAMRVNANHLRAYGVVAVRTGSDDS